MYTYNLTNIGTSDVNTSIVISTRNGEISDLLPLLSDTKLSPGNTSTIKKSEMIDLCHAVFDQTTVRAEARSHKIIFSNTWNTNMRPGFGTDCGLIKHSMTQI